MKGEAPEAMKPEFDDRKWETVTVPHDWAIFGPFDRSNDLQEVAVTQNFEKKASVKTGRTGGLPYVGIGLAMAGDMGGSIGPFVIGFVTQNTGDDLKAGMLAGCIFPAVLILSVFLLRQRNAEQK